MKLRFFCVLFISLLFGRHLPAQNMPAILVPDDEGKKHVPLTIDEIKIDVRIVGNIAVTTTEFTFFNPNNRVYEGQFYFPLGEGQSVSRFALDINGKMREGVVVEKAKGRQVFETIVRKNIDPGLLEWTKGNNFKSRIYPIPANGYRKVLVAYEQELTDAGRGFVYTLPLNYEKPVKKFSVSAEVFKQDIEPSLEDNKMQYIAFSKWRESYMAKAEFENYLPDKTLSFLLPKEADRQKVFMEETAEGSGEYYFYINLSPEMKTASKTMPKNIYLLWDVSASAAKRDIAKEIELLGTYFNTVRNLSVTLITFSNDIHSADSYPISGGNWQELKSKLESLYYDGGTQLGCLDLAKYSCDEFILCSDGLSNFGDSQMKTGSVPVIVINSSASADHSFLNYIASLTGGAYINLNRINNTQAIGLMTSQVYSFISAAYDKGSVNNAYPSVVTPIIKDFGIAGIMKGEATEITLNFGFGNRIEYSRKFILSKEKHLSDCGMIKRIWGQKKLAELDMNYNKNEAEITSLAKEMSIVTRNTSLIVLERLEDYVENRITPPEELKKEYLAAIEKIESESKAAEKSHLDEVLERFNKRKEWWNTKFSFGTPEIINKRKDKSMNGGDRGGDEEDSPLSVGFSSREVAAVPEGAPPTDELEKKEDEAASGTSEGTITLKKWEPDTPYLKDLKAATDDGLINEYLKQRKDYANSSAFYLDVADFFIEKGRRGEALRILSNIAEMELENHQLLRILGYRLKQLGYFKLAIAVFEEVLKIREEEPQSYRDLALALEADKQFARSADMFWHVVKTKWDERFPEIEVVALNEMNAMLANGGSAIDPAKFDKRLLFNMPVDMRVILTWDADLTDMDLWVTDPNGEKCFYGNNLTYIGAIMSRDFTRGYGPEEFLLKKAQPGKYTIEVNYYGNTQQVLAGATTIQVLLTTNFGTSKQKSQEITLRLKDKKEVINVGEFEFKP